MLKGIACRILQRAHTSFSHHHSCQRIQLARGHVWPRTLRSTRSLCAGRRQERVKWIAATKERKGEKVAQVLARVKCRYGLCIDQLFAVTPLCSSRQQQYKDSAEFDTALVEINKAIQDAQDVAGEVPLHKNQFERIVSLKCLAARLVR